MKPYASRQNAARGARQNLGREAVEGQDFAIAESPNGFIWRALKAEMPAGLAQAGLHEAMGGPLATEEVAADRAAIAPQDAQEPQVAQTGRMTKGGTVLRLLQRDGGATNAEIQEATGWQEHTVRGFFAGAQMKRTGFKAERFLRDDGTAAYRAATREA